MMAGLLGATRTLAVPMAALALLLACCTIPRQFTAVRALQNGFLTLHVDDTTGWVVGVRFVETPMPPDHGSGVSVENPDGDAGRLIVLWGGGGCPVDVTMRVTQAGDSLELAIDEGARRCLEQAELFRAVELAFDRAVLASAVRATEVTRGP